MWVPVRAEKKALVRDKKGGVVHFGQRIWYRSFCWKVAATSPGVGAQWLCRESAVVTEESRLELMEQKAVIVLQLVH